MAPSKMVNDRQRAATAVARAADTHADAVAAELAARLDSLAQGGEPAIPWAQLIRLLGRGIEATVAELAAADDAHGDEQRDDAAPRARRDRAAETVYAELVDLRAVTESVYGAAGVAALGFDGRTPQEPIALHRLGASAIDNAGALAALSPIRRGVTLNAADYLAPLTAGVAELRGALDDIARESAELDAALIRKDAAMAAHDHRFTHAARILEQLFSLSDRHELAARVRPSGSRPGRTHSDPDDDAAGAPAAERASDDGAVGASTAPASPSG
jgi:hypothetical protein